MAAKKGRTKETRSTMNFWQFINNVLIASLSKGQFIPACIFFLLLLALVRMPEGDVSKLLFEIEKDLKEGYLIGFSLDIFLVIGWYVHLRKQRKDFGKEIDRISQERDAYQEKLNGEAFTKSSRQ